jgi:hypothetical protein
VRYDVIISLEITARKSDRHNKDAGLENDERPRRTQFRGRPELRWAPLVLTQEHCARQPSISVVHGVEQIVR